MSNSDLPIYSDNWQSFLESDHEVASHIENVYRDRLNDEEREKLFNTIMAKLEEDSMTGQKIHDIAKDEYLDLNSY